MGTSKSIQQSNNSSFGSTKINHHPIKDLNIYEVSESELIELEKGNDADIFFNFAIACLSIFITAITAVCTGNFSKEWIETTFICVTIITLIIGLLLFFLWNRKRKNKTNIISKIRGREAR